MPRRLRERLSYANVMSSIAVILALGTGGAYAANTIRSSDIVDGIGSADIKDTPSTPSTCTASSAWMWSTDHSPAPTWPTHLRWARPTSARKGCC